MPEINMKKFFKYLLSSSNEVSSRRFIALIILPSFVIGIFVGIFSSNYNFYLTAMISAGVIILIAYFTLTFNNIKDILNSNTFGKKSRNHNDWFNNQSDDDNDEEPERIEHI